MLRLGWYVGLVHVADHHLMRGTGYALDELAVQKQLCERFIKSEGTGIPNVSSVQRPVPPRL